MVKFVFKALLLLFILGCGVTYWVYQDYLNWLEKPIPIESVKIVSIEKGIPFKSLVKKLKQEQIIDNEYYFRFKGRVEGHASKIKAGRYKFEGMITPEQVLTDLIEGNVFRIVSLKVTIPEGFTVPKIQARLHALGVGDRSEIKAAFEDQPLQKLLTGMEVGFEGFLYPATYIFYDDMPKVNAVISKMVKKLFQIVPETTLAALEEKGLTLYDSLKFASLIELETRYEDEKPKIAEVIWNRLKAGQPLGIDAAIIYGIDDYDGDLTWAHLKDKKNPYNLRIHKGLPPSPIGSPALSSIEAILNPTKEGYYYYVIKKNTNGRHVFSKTLAEHNINVKKFLQK